MCIRPRAKSRDTLFSDNHLNLVKCEKKHTLEILFLFFHILMVVALHFLAHSLAHNILTIFSLTL